MTTEAGTPGGSAERPAVFFRDADEFRAWLEQHHESETELWMGLRKAHVADRGLTWAEAVPEALCFGWIDSLSQPIDADSRRQRWTPRKPGSTWSLVNVQHVERLRAEGRMHPAGIAAFERRQEAKTGTYSFESDAAELDPEFAAALEADAAASAFWHAATAGYRKAAQHWVMQAKQAATRERRAAELVTCCAAGELIPPQRYGTTPSWLARASAAARDATAR